MNCLKLLFFFLAFVSQLIVVAEQLLETEDMEERLVWLFAGSMWLLFIAYIFYFILAPF